VLGVRAELGPQLAELRHGEPAVLGQDGSRGVLETLRELGDSSRLVRPCHGPLLDLSVPPGPHMTRAPRAGTGLGRFTGRDTELSPAQAPHPWTSSRLVTGDRRSWAAV